MTYKRKHYNRVKSILKDLSLAHLDPNEVLRMVRHLYRREIDTCSDKDFRQKVSGVAHTLFLVFAV